MVYSIQKGWFLFDTNRFFENLSTLSPTLNERMVWFIVFMLSSWFASRRFHRRLLQSHRLKSDNKRLGTRYAKDFLSCQGRHSWHSPSTTPALLTSTSSLGSVLTMSSANALTDLNEARSRCLMITGCCVSSKISCAADFASFRSQQAMMTRAFRLHKSFAVSLPMPEKKIKLVSKILMNAEISDCVMRAFCVRFNFWWLVKIKFLIISDGLHAQRTHVSGFVGIDKILKFI